MVGTRQLAGSLRTLGLLGAAIGAVPLAWVACDPTSLDWPAAGAPADIFLSTLIAAACTMVLLATCLWFAVAVFVAAAEAHGRTVPAVIGRLSPPLARRLVAVAVGAGLVGAAAPAMADTGAPAAPRHPFVSGLQLPDRVVAAPPSAPTGHVTVVAGDSLWSLGAQTLHGDASDPQITRAWQALYAANRDVIGPDPDLILPGTALTISTGEPR